MPTSTIESKKKSSTYRDEVKIPKLPESVESLGDIPQFEMEKSKMVEGSLVFDNEAAFDKALSTGFFLVEIPKNLNLLGSDRLVESFYKNKDGGRDDAYMGFKDIEIAADYQGYFDRPHDQWENLYIEADHWERYLPDDVRQAGLGLAQLGIDILRNVLKKIGIHHSEWDKVTGGLTADKGHQMLAFNHFRPEKETRGTKLHRDSGWVTILRSTRPGLVALIGEQLYAINPKPGYFIVNFGSSFEVLTEQFVQPVRGNIHGVVRTVKGDSDRTSYVIFLDSDLSGDIYRYENGKSVPVQTMKEFAIQEVNRTYDDGGYL